MKQKLKLSSQQRLSLDILDILDIIDMQSICLSAENIAQKLVEKYNYNFEEIEKEILKIPVPEVVKINKEFNFHEEILWAAKWILSIRS